MLQSYTALLLYATPHQMATGGLVDRDSWGHGLDLASICRNLLWLVRERGYRLWPFGREFPCLIRLD